MPLEIHEIDEQVEPVAPKVPVTSSSTVAAEQPSGRRQRTVGTVPII